MARCATVRECERVAFTARGCFPVSSAVPSTDFKMFVLQTLVPPAERSCLKRSSTHACSPVGKARRVTINADANKTRLVPYYGRPAQSPELAKKCFYTQDDCARPAASRITFCAASFLTVHLRTCRPRSQSMSLRPMLIASRGSTRWAAGGESRYQASPGPRRWMRGTWIAM